jgi:hypothetical protein
MGRRDCTCITLGRGLGRLSGVDAACFGDGSGLHRTACTYRHGYCFACVVLLETKNVIVKNESRFSLVCSIYMQRMPNVSTPNASCDPES